MGDPNTCTIVGMLFEVGMLYEGPYYLDHSGHVVEPEGALVVPAHYQSHTLEMLSLDISRTNKFDVFRYFSYTILP